MEALNNAQQTLKNVTGSPQSGGKKKGCGCSSPVQLGGKKTRRNRKIKGGEGELQQQPTASDQPSSLFKTITDFARNTGDSIKQGYENTKKVVSNQYNSMRGRDDDDNTQNAVASAGFNNGQQQQEQQTPLTAGGRKRKSKKHRKKSRKHRKRSKKHRKRSKKSRR